jgi:DNA modification methylase
MTTIEGRNWKVLVGDVRERLADIPEGYVQCCVTSPPYWGLRDYGTGTWEGGDAACEHKPVSGIQGQNGQRADRRFTGEKPQGATCLRCGARRIDNQIGLEDSPAAFVEAMVGVFREVWRCLRDDGLLFLNLGDSYASSGKSRTEEQVTKNSNLQGGLCCQLSILKQQNKVTGGLKPKDLCGIPWRVVLALQEDGWYWRDAIVWNKPAPMPESVRDRCTKAWEPIFMLAKSELYFCDMETVRERGLSPEMDAAEYKQHLSAAEEQWYARASSVPANGKSGNKTGGFCPPGGRNLRNVWSLAPCPFPDAHFATFPPSLPERCIKMGTSERGCCPSCRAPWKRVTEREVLRRERPNQFTKYRDVNGQPDQTKAGVSVQTKGWEPTCDCGEQPIPCCVLDPFSGSGTTGMVSTELGREYIGVELNPEYAEMSRTRIDSWKHRDAPKPAKSIAGQRGLFDESV